MRRVVAVAVVLVTIVAATPEAAYAGESDEDATLETSVSDTTTAPPTGGEEPADCWWSRVPANEAIAELYNVVEHVVTIIATVLTMRRHEITVEYYSEANTLHRYNEVNGLYEYKLIRVCRPGYEPGVGEIPIGTPEWVEATDPDPGMLLTRTEVVRTLVAAPVPEVSPSPEVGAPVNLGLWVAIAEAGPYEARASLGPRVWARRTATLEGIWFDPGNGDERVWCEGRGTPLSPGREDTIEPGPCGYVYERHGDVVADLTVTLVAQWRVTWELSNGTSGTDPDPILTSTSFPYDVYEIQTVGVGN